MKDDLSNRGSWWQAYQNGLKQHENNHQSFQVNISLSTCTKHFMGLKQLHFSLVSIRHTTHRFTSYRYFELLGNPRYEAK